MSNQVKIATSKYSTDDIHGKKYLLYSTYLMLIISSMGAGLVLPILPELFLNNQYGLIVGHTTILSKEMLYSLALALFPLSSMFGMPALGVILDKYDKHTVILSALGALILNYVLSIVSILIHSVWLFLLSRVLSGFLSGIYAIGLAIISTLSDTTEERISRFKLPAIAPILGLILGTCISLFFDKITIINPLILPFLIMCFLGQINLFLLCKYKFHLTEKKKTSLNVYSINSRNSLGVNHNLLPRVLKSIIRLFSYAFDSKTNRMIALSYFLLQFACNIYTQSLLLHLSIQHNYTPSMISAFFVIMILGMTSSIYIFSYMINKYMDFVKQIKMGLILTSLLFFIAVFVVKYSKLQHNIHVIWIVTFMFYVLIPFSTLGFTNLVAIYANKQEQGRAMGAMGQLSSISILISALCLWQNNIKHERINLIVSVCLGLSYVILRSAIKGICSVRLKSSINSP